MAWGRAATMDQARLPVSSDFLAAVEAAVVRARQSPDECVAFMAAGNVPVFAQRRPDLAQARAGGCTACTYLGLWADSWVGYEWSEHGIIWLFEEGIRKQGGDLTQQALITLLHEMDHALQRDHVLEALGRRQTATAAAAGVRDYDGGYGRASP